MLKNGEECPTRLELAGACASSDQFFANVLAASAFCIIQTQRLYSPGSVMPSYVREYYPSTTVPHLYLTAPFLWEDALKTLDCGTKKVSWLLVVPISDAENAFLDENGDAALEDFLQEQQIDVFDLSRQSVV
jgi:antitoxin YqcF